MDNNFAELLSSCPAGLTCGSQAESKAFVENTGWASEDPDYLQLGGNQLKLWALLIWGRQTFLASGITKKFYTPNIPLL